MKIDRLLPAFVLVVAATALSASAQTRPAGTPAQQPAAPQSTGPIPDSKIAWIYSEAFQDPKTGIARLNDLAAKLNREFQPRQTELNQLQQKAQQLNDDIEKTKNVADPKTLQQKADQLQQLQVDIKRKQEDGQAALEKRQQEMFAPLEQDIDTALKAYAKAHGISVIIDRSRVPLVYAADTIDITRAFINEFNSKNPVTASAATPPE